MSFQGGVKEAAKMLQGLGGSAAKKLLEEIRARDPKMAAEIEKSLVTMEDLKYLTPAMLVGLLRDVNLEMFGLALRGVDQETTSKILGMVSTGIKLDIEDGLKSGPKPIKDVEEAQSKILEVVRKKIEQGTIVLDPEGDTLV